MCVRREMAQGEQSTYVLGEHDITEPVHDHACIDQQPDRRDKVQHIIGTADLTSVANLAVVVGVAVGVEVLAVDDVEPGRRGHVKRS